jgi:hypothetical protein
MAVPYTFGSATASIPLSQLDSNFATAITLGNTAVQLGNTITTLTGVTNLASSGALTLGSNGNTTAITIDTSQNVGIGVTPSAWATLLPVQIKNGYVAGYLNRMYVGANNYYDGSNSRYIATDYATRYYQNAGQHIWETAASGTAGNVITFTQAMTLDASGNLGVGTTSPANSSGGTCINVAGTYAVFTGTIPTAGNGTTWEGRLTGRSVSARYGQINLQTDSSSNGFIQFNTATAGSDVSERMRIDTSGNLLVGTTTSSLYNQNTVNGISVVPGTSSAIQVANDPAASSGNACILLNFRNSPASGSKYLRTFYNGTTETGSISLNGTSNVLYNISSDYRLKNNPVPITGAKDFVMALQPKTWDWWDNSGKGVGFIAHEFMEVAKYSGNGEKDAVDADGKPIHQSIQPSSPEVMANIVALMQEQQTTITAQAETINALTARIVALESK